MVTRMRMTKPLASQAGTKESVSAHVSDVHAADLGTTQDSCRQ